MTLLYPSRRQINMSAPSTCFATSTPFKIPKYVPTAAPEKEHIEVNRVYFTSYEELNFRLEGLTSNSNGDKVSRTTSSDCTEYAKVRSILKKSRSVDSINRNIINVPYLLRTSDCSSLEWDKTGNENSSKNVTFADDKNQNLVEVRTFVPSLLGTDILSKSPDLSNNGFLNVSSIRKEATTKSLSDASWKPDISLCFKEPCMETDFHEKLLSRFVCLEKCGTRNRLITGLVLVKNIEYEKAVFIRYTIDKWKSHSDTDAIYLSTVQEGIIDRFTFTLNLPTRSNELEFAICYNTSKRMFWDNNDNKNYRVEDALQLPA